MYAQVEDSLDPTIDIDPKTFRKSLAREIMHSERRREAILAAIYSILLLTSLAVINLYPDLIEPGFQEKLTLLAAAATVYELFVWALTGLVFKARDRLPALFRYANVFVEVSFITVFSGVIAESFNPLNALISPISLVYFVFIILAALRLDFVLCVFTGLVAGLQYIGLAYYYIPQVESVVHPVMLLPIYHISKGGIMIGAGVIAGIVTLVLRGRVIEMLTTVSERNQIVDIFGQHVSPQVVEEILKRDIADIPSQKRYLAVMFLDLRGFTSYAAERDPEKVIDYLNTLYDMMIVIIDRHQGVIIKYLGDGFLVVFGAPLDDPQCREHAVETAMEIIDEIEKRSANKEIPHTRVGIGIHAGDAVVGNLGSTNRKEYTVVGDVVNLASRIEQLTKDNDAKLLVSAEVWDVVREEHPYGLDLGWVQIRGFKHPTRLYQLR